MGEGRHTPSISRVNSVMSTSTALPHSGTAVVEPFPKYGLQVLVLSARWSHGHLPLTVISALSLDLVSGVKRTFSIER